MAHLDPFSSMIYLLDLLDLLEILGNSDFP